MVTINLPDGRWLKMRLPTVNEHLAIADLPDLSVLPKGPEKSKANIERLRFYRDMLKAATIETSWGGDVGDLHVRVMDGLIAPWLRAAEDDAVPPESGSNSSTQPADPRSPEPMGDPQS